MHRFDYRFLADSLPANILEIAGIIYDLRGKGEIRKNNHPQVFQELRHIAMIDSVQSSNAIEGIVKCTPCQGQFEFLGLPSAGYSDII